LSIAELSKNFFGVKQHRFNEVLFKFKELSIRFMDYWGKLKDFSRT